MEVGGKPLSKKENEMTDPQEPLEHDRVVPMMNFDDLRKVKPEKGDILLVTVPRDTPSQQLKFFRKSFTKQVVEMFGEVIVVVAAAVPGTMSMDLVKSKDLSDIYQRLDKLESETFYGGK
ncbi:MAG: hypothetical protein ACYTEX_11165 [Planctomycetota bacterium]|jgi:hypothetical protein